MKFVINSIKISYNFTFTGIEQVGGCLWSTTLWQIT